VEDSAATARVRILCVDDEPCVLEGLRLTLGRQHFVETATSGAAALQLIGLGNPYAVVVSDMRMAAMDGATLLGRIRKVAPDTVRILLTGDADLEAAIAAVNEGQIFRFLTKPCAPATLRAAIEAAARQHRLQTAERVLLEETLHGTVEMLTDALALANPLSFGRAARVKRRVSDLARKLGMRECWQVEVAAMLSQLGALALPDETAAKLHAGKPLSPEEEAMVARVPALTEHLLGPIPRLEAVRGILASYRKTPSRPPGDPPLDTVERGAGLLRVAVDFDDLDMQGRSAEAAIADMRGRPERYDVLVLDALEALENGESTTVVEEVPVSALHVDMVLVEDLHLANGTLLVPRGHTVTAALLARIRNFAHGMIGEPVRVATRRRDNRGAHATTV
jgi:DNA-binding response OmpR family regulator